MSNKIAPQRALVLTSLAIMLCICAVSTLFSNPPTQSRVPINIKGQPTLGFSGAKVHIVVFEEPKCVNCKTFSQKIAPEIKKEFVDTNKATYTVIPVSFLPGSMPAAIALLCVYHQDPLYPNDELFFTYMDAMYSNQESEESDWATPEKMTELAGSASEAIDPTRVRKCISKQIYRVQIEKNTAYGKSLMGGTIGTPTVYVNGIELKELDTHELRKLILEVMAEEGVSK